jgi:hypothetical protein
MAVVGLHLPAGTFRPRELERVLAMLGERRPAVILVTGDPGMGKTSFLSAVRGGAAALGWATAGGEPDGRLVIHPHTRDPEFREAVLAMLPATDKRRLGAEVSAPSASGAPELFAAELGRLAPLLVLIDDYRPSPSFAEWFERGFLPAVPRRDASLVVVVAERPGTRPLEALATETLELGPLESAVVRSALLGMLPPLEPPLSEQELEQYVSAAKNPVVLASLIRVLSLGSASKVPV